MLSSLQTHKTIYNIQQISPHDLPPLYFVGKNKKSSSYAELTPWTGNKHRGRSLVLKPERVKVKWEEQMFVYFRVLFSQVLSSTRVELSFTDISLYCDVMWLPLMQAGIIQFCRALYCSILVSIQLSQLKQEQNIVHCQSWSTDARDGPLWCVFFVHCFQNIMYIALNKSVCQEIDTKT